MILATGFVPSPTSFQNASFRWPAFPILDNTLAHLAALGTEEIAIVVGHHKELIIERYGKPRV